MPESMVPDTSPEYIRVSMFKPEFYLLTQECDLAKASLLGAFTDFSYMQAGQTGTMYSAFFQAATGLERPMKLIVIIDHNGKHDLASPTNEQLRKIGHDLSTLYDRCSSIAGDLGMDPAEWFSAATLERQMLKFLSVFAKQTRYYNLDAISGSKKAIDPIGEWTRIHQLIAERLSSTRREKNQRKSAKRL